MLNEISKYLHYERVDPTGEKFELKLRYHSLENEAESVCTINMVYLTEMISKISSSIFDN